MTPTVTTTNTINKFIIARGLLNHAKELKEGEYESTINAVKKIFAEITQMDESKLPESCSPFYLSILSELEDAFKYKGVEFSEKIKNVISKIKHSNTDKYVRFSGAKMKVVSEDDSCYVVEGENELQGVKLRVTKEEVMLDKPEDDKLMSETEYENPEFSEPSEDILPSERKDGSDLIVKEDSVDRPNYPDIGIDVAVTGTKERHAMNAERRKDALVKFKEGLRKMLEDLDAVDEEVAPGTMTETEEPGSYKGVKITPSHGKSPISGEEITTFAIVWPDGKIEDGYDSEQAAKDKVDYFLSKYPDAFKKEKLEEDGECGGTATSGVATFAGRMGIGLSSPQRRKETYKNI